MGNATFCPNTGMAKPRTCLAGTFCPDGSVYAKDCPEGSFCPEGSAKPVACPVGTFCPNKRTRSMEDATVCTAGMYCNRVGLRQPSGSCNGGYFCPAGSVVSTQNLCPEDSYCPHGSASPLTCPDGTHSDVGMSKKDRCK